MKKTFFVLAVVLLLAGIFSAAVSAEEYTALTDGTVNPEEEFSFLTIHSPKSFSANDASAESFGDTIEWITQNKEMLNLQYVSLLGDMTLGSVSLWADYTHLGMPGYIDVCLQEEQWHAQWERMSNAASPLSDAGIPFSVASGFTDYPGGGKLRNNLFTQYFPEPMLFPDGAFYDRFDECNYYYCFTAGKTDYMVMTLELWPRKTILDWANNVISQNPEKRVVIITGSLIRPNGELYRMWDWQIKIDKNLTNAEFYTEQYMRAPEVTTQMTDGNMTWTDYPRDGDHLWSYSFAKHDNIFLIITSRDDKRILDYKGQIVTAILKNNAGYDVAVVLANIDRTLAAQMGCIPLLTTISNDGKNIKINYCDIYEGIWDDSQASLALNLKTVAESEGLKVAPTLKKQSIGTNIAYIKGYEENTFRPQNNMTRAEACTIIARLLDPEESFRGENETRFADVGEGDWYYDAIAYLDANEFLNRYAGTYAPNQNITRAEFVELAYLAGGFGEGTRKVYFADVKAGHPYYDAVFAAAKAGLVNGYEDETFRPDNTVTRAEVVTIVNRIIGTVGSEKVIGDAQVNIFSDISGHWAYYNIIMASNSRIIPAYCKDIDTSGISEDGVSIKLENKNLSITISKKYGNVTDIFDKISKTDIRNPGGVPQFCYFSDSAGVKSNPIGASLDNNRLCFRFKDGARVYLIAQVYDDYMTFEVDSYGYATYYNFTFANLNALYDWNTGDPVVIASLPMKSIVNNVYYPDAKDQRTIALTYGELGVDGAKLGVATVPKSRLRDVLKTIVSGIKKGDAPVSVGVGGPWALDNPLNYGDYIIIDESDADIILGDLDMYLEYGLDQLDFHQGPRTFRQGDFYFYKYASAAEFKEKIADPLLEHGIVSGLHTYSFYILPTATPLLSDPRWQPDLLVAERYTLAADIGKFSTDLPTIESTKNAFKETGYRATASEYILIDQEILRIDTKQIGDKKFSGVRRAQCGTASQEHAAGAAIKRIGSYYNGLAPTPGSGLFYEVARLTAKAYNEGGFGMIYFDALNGMSMHTTGDYYSYYVAEFVNAVMKDCVVPPIVEMPGFTSTLWTVRGRMGAWDHPRRGYKEWNQLHIDSNIQFIDRFYPTMLGWYNFYPMVDLSVFPGNWQVKYYFFDDVDHMGSLAVAYNQSIVYNVFTPTMLEETPALRRNMQLYQLYSRLRKTNYFSESIKTQIKNGKYEYAIVEKSAGVYVFVEKSYVRGKILDAAQAATNAVSGSNPFGAQEPFIRIEGSYSSKGENPITVMEFNESKNLTEQTLKRSIPSLIDATDHYALRVRVYGNNSTDALCIRLRGYVTGDTNTSDYIVKLNFTGWREFIFVDTDNDYDRDITFSGRSTGSYEFLRGITNFNMINEAQVFLSGKCEGVKISNLELCKHTENAVTNPAVTVGSETVTFACTLGSDEYIEYFPGQGALIYDAVGNARPVDGISGKLTVGGGAFTASLSGTFQGNGPSRARLSFGFTGAELK